MQTGKLSPRAERIIAWTAKGLAQLIMMAISVSWGFYVGQQQGFRAGVDASIGELVKGMERSHDARRR